MTPPKVVDDLQLGDKKVTLNHLVVVSFDFSKYFWNVHIPGPNWER